MRNEFPFRLSACVMALVFPSLLNAQCDEVFIQPDGTGNNHRFGFSIATHGTRAISSGHGPFPPDARAYVYVRNEGNWALEATLMAPPPAEHEDYGFRVGIWENWAFVTDPEAEPTGLHDSGATYVYRKDGGQWIPDVTLFPDDLDEDDEFGSSIDVSNGILVVGAERENPGGVGDAGAVYVFRHESGEWVQEAKLTASDASNNDYFGRLVDIDGDRIAVSSQQVNGPNVMAGTVYLFHWTGEEWIEEEQFRIGFTVNASFFGFDLSLEGDRLVISAAGGTSAGKGAGAVLEYHRVQGEWIQAAQLTFPEAADNATYGRSVALSGDYLAVGAPKDDLVVQDSGSVSLFRLDQGQWTLESRFASELLIETPEFFSTDLEFGDGFLLVTAPDFALNGEGAAFCYNIGPACSFIRGDCDSNGSLSVADVVFGMVYFFTDQDEAPAMCDVACDVNDDGILGIVDMVQLSYFLFQTSAPPPAQPYPDCGIDPTVGESIHCHVSPDCP